MGMAERIKERRKAMGYTQTELGEKLGLQASAIAKYENGRVVNLWTYHPETFSALPPVDQDRVTKKE